jgi:hypothetical protein
MTNNTPEVKTWMERMKIYLNDSKAHSCEAEAKGVECCLKREQNFILMHVRKVAEELKAYGYKKGFDEGSKLTQ